MQLAGVIAEYNPFHSGHAAHLAATRAQGATHIAVLMSGSFVQRGDIACFSKFARARAAAACGADLVLELPQPYAVASARTFARAGVFLANELGADFLSFGCEEPDPARLREAARQAEQAEGSPEMTAFLRQGMSYPRARAAAVRALYGGEAAERLTRPNNLLAAEYLRAMREGGGMLEPLFVRREQAHHDSDVAGGSIASASKLRSILRKQGLSGIEPYIPAAAGAVYRGEQEARRGPVFSIDRIALAALRDLSPADFAALPDVNEGFENRMFRAVRAASSLTELFEAAKMKRFTMARIRRIAYCGLLGVTKEDQARAPGYLRVLAMNERGVEILARAKNVSTLPVGANFADLYRLDPPGLEFDVRATDLYALAMPRVHPAGMDFTEKLSVVSARRESGEN